MRVRPLFCYLFLLFPTVLFAQGVPRKNSIDPNGDMHIDTTKKFVTSFYFEAAGNGIAASVNLEEKFSNVVTLRAGIGGFGRVEVHTSEGSSATRNTYIWKP